MVDNPTENILDAARNIAYDVIDLKDVNDIIGGESTRIMNIYSRYIGTKSEGPNYKSVYDSAKDVCKQCDSISKSITKLKNKI